ncbi:MAG: DHA2 family efflux MFS transporter permease subunit [Gemmatimonadota bacterium]
MSAAAPTANGAGRPAPSHAHPPLTGSALVVGTLALSLATFMNVLDTSIANVSIPAISGDLGVSPSQGTWVITSFGVANAISLPLTGWLTQRFGQVRLFLASIVLFVISSFLCGLAPNLQTLITFRVLQGFVAGPMIPLSQTLLLSSYPARKSGTALAFWGMTTLIAPVVGPLAGGWITDNIGWPWIFFINVPIGLGAAFVTWTLYHRRETPTRKVPIDGVGLALLVLWVGSLQIMLDKGKELDWFASDQIVALAIVAVIGFAFFLAWELTDAHPVVEVRLFARRNFLFATTSIAVAYGLFFGNLVLLPLWLQQWMGYTATQAGWALAPVGALAMLLTPVVGRFVNRVDPRPIVTISFLVFALVMYLRSLFTTETDLATIMVPTVIQGAAVACFFIPLMAIALSGLTPDRIAGASGLTNFARITAGSFGTSISTTLWEQRASLHHSQLVEHLTRGDLSTDRFFDTATHAGLTHEQALALLNRIVDTQAFTLSVDELFYLSALLFLVLVGLVWLTRPQRGGLGAVDSGAH